MPRARIPAAAVPRWLTSQTRTDTVNPVPATYSTYEAKARLSEILRQVRAGKTVRISYRGEAIAEIRPLRRTRGGLEQRLQDLAERGALVPGAPGKGDYRPVARRPGALRRFLADRNA
jgi:prevent-host-death family protein